MYVQTLSIGKVSVLSSVVINSAIHAATVQRWRRNILETNRFMILTRNEADAAKAKRQQVADDFNLKNPIGTRVRYWSGVRGPAHTATETTVREPAIVLGGHTPVVWVTGRRDPIALTHVERIWTAKSEPEVMKTVELEAKPVEPTPTPTPINQPRSAAFQVAKEATEPLYGGMAPFEKGSDTSKAAAEAIQPDAARLRSLVMDAFKEAGAKGLTSNEVELKLGLRQSTASARVREVVLLGNLVESGTRKTASGRNAKVFVWTDEPVAKSQVPATRFTRKDMWAAIRRFTEACDGTVRIDAGHAQLDASATIDAILKSWGHAN